MTAFVAFCVHHVRQLLTRTFPRSRHSLLVERTPYGLPVPKTIHRTISEEELGGRKLVVIGDVHGCYDELMELLKICNTDDNVCPVFVGDLVWKGPYSAEVIKLIRSLDCYCVRGNSDEVAMLSWQRYVEGEDQELDKKGKWLLQLSNEDIEWLFSLPYTLSFPSRQTVVVHAGLVPGVDLESQSLDNMLHLRDVTFDSKSLTFSGHVKYQPNGQPWAHAWGGPEQVYFGHDARRFFQSYPYATGIDLGCVYGGHLAAVVPDRDNELIKVKAHQAYQKTSENRVESAPPKL